MARVTSPLLSFDSRGQIANTQVYATWRGVQYARKYVIPANPDTAEQKETRTVFSYLNAVWKLMAAEAQAPWTAFAKGQPFINRNAWISKNLPPLRGETDNEKLIGSPGANGGLPVASFTATGSAGKITCTFTMPSLPTGWTVASSVAIAFPDGNPQTTTDFSSVTGTATATPWSIELTVDAGEYVVAGWATYTKPDGSTAYSVGITTTATAT